MTDNDKVDLIVKGIRLRIKQALEKKLWLLLPLVLAIVPFKLPTKALVSADEIRTYYSGKTGPVPLHSELKFKVFVPDARQTRYLVDRLSAAIRRYEYSLSLVVGTYERTNRCELVLWLEGIGNSKPVRCSGLEDNRAATFYFEKPIPPGVHEGVMKRSGEAGDLVALYYYEGSSSDAYWLMPHGHEATVLLFELLTQLPSKPRHGIAYFLCLVVAVFALGSKKKYSILLSMAVLYLGVTLISKSYSGFDETAHIDMMHKQFHGAAENRPEFWHRVYEDMLRERFPQLHGGITPQDAVCPHQVLGHCGRSSMPERLYGFYFSIINQLEITKGLDLDSPSTLRAIGIAFNAMWLLILLALTWILIGPSGLLAMACILILYGGSLSQFATITNDVPLIFFGLLIMTVITGPLIRDSLLRDILGWLLLLLLFACSLLIDRSSIAAVPLILSVPIVILFAQKHSLAQTGWVQIVRAAGLSLLIVGLTFVSIHYLVDVDPWNLFARIASWKSDFLILQGIAKFDRPTLSILYVWQYLKSFFGSYIWGHSYYHSLSYWVLFGFFTLLSLYGIGRLADPGRRARTLLAVLSMLIGIQIVVALSIPVAMVGFSDLPVVRDSYLKTRLTAPALAAILNFAFMGFCHFAEKQNGKGNVWPFFVTKIWTVVLLTVYLPTFYVLDAY